MCASWGVCLGMEKLQHGEEVVNPVVAPPRVRKN